MGISIAIQKNEKNNISFGGWMLHLESILGQ